MPEIKNSSIYVGIDLGTTNTVMAVCRKPKKGGFPLPKVRDINQYITARHMGIQKWLPSVLFFDADKKIKVGQYAHDRKDMGADKRILYNTKIDMGRQVVYENGLTPAEAAAEILKVCHNTIQQSIIPHGEDFPEVTITVPASFNQSQIADTLEAAKLAGFEKVSILEEPVAALYNYILGQTLSGDEQLIDFSEKKRLLVYDIGGGTCDVCVVDLKIDNGIYEIHFVATNRYTEFGGADFDEQIAIGLLNKLFKRYNISDESVNSPEIKNDLVAKLLPYCEGYKKFYSDQLNNGFSPEEVRDAEFGSLAKFMDYENVELDVTYKEYEEYTKIFFDDSYRHPVRDLTDKMRDKNIFKPVHQLLKRLKENGERGIDCVFLTGGMSKYLPIEIALEKFCKCPVLKSDEPMDAVALGASVSKLIITNKVNENMINMQEETETLEEISAESSDSLKDERPRLAEAIFIDVENQLPMKIIDAGIAIPCKGEVEHEFHVGSNGVRFHLFAGQSHWDPEMRILYDYTQTFQALVKPGTAAHIRYEIDEDRFLKMQLVIDDVRQQVLDLTVDTFGR